MMTTESPRNPQDIKNQAADLYWLAFLLTGRQDIGIEIAADTAVSAGDASPFFSSWMRGWQRRLVIGRALAAIHDELADSARRTRLARVNGPATLPPNWSLDPNTTRADLEQALLAIDPFPRAAVLLLIFEGIRIADAATLLDADPSLIRKAQAIGLWELTSNLAGTHPPGNDHRTAPKSDAPKKLCCWLRITAVCH
jgi:DNA-directed RNA polymerase specialized sigma24 family protein